MLVEKNITDTAQERGAGQLKGKQDPQGGLKRCSLKLSSMRWVGGVSTPGLVCRLHSVSTSIKIKHVGQN